MCGVRMCVCMYAGAILEHSLYLAQWFTPESRDHLLVATIIEIPPQLHTINYSLPGHKNTRLATPMLPEQS